MHNVILIFVVLLLISGYLSRWIGRLLRLETAANRICGGDDRRSSIAGQIDEDDRVCVVGA
ncbi:MAG: hypothetical protein KME15_26260 [Drouetiella hepatica Uher 2000/2452]|jgi:hypothetical protein|uniref:Uncharacterized protein n=1 Tax=Drouetiella hepatica Uher 2000/2452 TaxID=904376 RepID=A0A951QGF9_9CYAN|nr:hypothetical protein [Drouetiella hepatica Uher 2000/2452]